MTLGIRRLAAAIRRAFGRFLALPVAVTTGFIGLGIGIYFADRAWSNGHVPAGFAWLGELLGDNQALGGLLTTVASSIITVTSITFSLLLVAVQQGAAALTAQVTDQFLMRRTNQFYFGFFVGLSIYVLLTLVTVSGIHRPVFGASVALVFTAVALCLIVVMIYNTIHQMRPGQIVSAIHEHILQARSTELTALAATRRSARSDWPIAAVIRAEAAGFVAAVKFAALEAALEDKPMRTIEAQLLAPVGTAIAHGDPLFVLRLPEGTALDGPTLSKLDASLRRAVVLDDDRDLRRDARYGLYQLSTMAWTSVSTAKSNPSPAHAVVDALRDLISRWDEDDASVSDDPEARIVCADPTPVAAMDALEAIIVGASESIQAQTLAKALQTVAVLLGHVHDATAERLADVARRALSTLGEHVLTRELEAALGALSFALTERGFGPDGRRVATATAALAQSLGRLNSRSTRVPSAP